jgi:hypothetical protein
VITCKKFFLGSCIHLLVQKFFLCIGITYLSLFLSDLFISNLLSSSCALVFRLGQNLSNIPRSILSKKIFFTYLTFIRAQSFKILPLFFRSDFFLSTELHKSSRILCTKQQIYAQSFLFSSVPNNHSFRSRQQNHLLAQGQTQGSMLQQCTNKTLTTGPFGNTCEADEVSPEVEAGVVAGLKCLQPSWDTDL